MHPIRKIILIIILVLLYEAIPLYAQSNLLLNPGFEEDSFCTLVGAEDGLYAGCAKNWHVSNLNGGVSLYLNICSNEITSGLVFTRVPENSMGYEFPHTGVAFAGLGLYGKLGDNINQRGYNQGTLRDTLSSSKTYGISYFISQSDYMMGFLHKFCIDNIGFYFSDTSVFYSTWDTLPFTPQYKNEVGNILNVSNGWQKVEGKVNVQGGERYVIIGNFDNNQNTNIYDCFGNGADSSDFGSLFFYIDDISIIDTSIIDTVKLCINDSVYIEGAWHKTAGLYYDTVAGMPYQKYIQPISYASTHTLIYFEGNVGDSVKTAYFWSKIFAGKDTTFSIVMPSVYGCDSTIVCRLKDKDVSIQSPVSYESASLKIYPNPSTDIINIDIKLAAIKNQKTKDFKLLVYDMMGKQVNCNFVLKNNTETNLSYQGNINKLSTGMYFIKVFSSNNNNALIGMGRFIKE